MEKKLNVGFLSNCVVQKTGLARNAKDIVTTIFKKSKYNIFFLNQGMPDNHPDYLRLPWKNFGVMKNFDQNRFNQDQGYQRAVAYGGPAVEEFVISNKIDVFITFDDIWAFPPEFYYQTNWYKHMKDNVLVNLTIDSEPIMPQAKDWAVNCPNLHVWSGFAKRVLEKEDFNKYKHIQVLRGAVSGEFFRPLPQEERLQLRRKWNITDDEKIVIYVARNQLRKIFSAHMEGLVAFRRKHPEKKTRLLFHTNFSEGSGWPIAQIRDELGLKPEDVLATYYCGKCHAWSILPFTGEGLNCPHCLAEKSINTVSIGSNISEEELNKIYNISDCCASIFTSGGQENNCPEAMLCGLPLACPNYSSGEDFINTRLVYEIEGSYTREHNTSFKKFVPDNISVAKFYEYVWNLTPDKRNKLTKEAREWALKEFSPQNLAEQIERFIDSRQPVDWDKFIQDKKDVKNVSAQIPLEVFNLEKDEEFVTRCYKIILNMDVGSQDSGLLHWLNFLRQPQDKKVLRENLINSFRMAGQEHNQKNNVVSFETLLNNNDKKRFLIVCKESAGDILYSTSLLKSFRESYPKEEWDIYYACKPEFSELLDNCPYIDRVLPYMPHMDSEIGMTGQVQNKGFFQGYCNLTANTQYILNYLTNNKVNLQLEY